MLLNDTIVWSTQYNFDLDLIHLNFIESLSEYPGNLHLNVEFSFNNAIDYEHSLRVQLPNNINQGDTRVYLSDNNPFVPFSGFIEFTNIIIHNDHTYMRYIIIPAALNNLIKNNRYILRVELNQPDINLDSVDLIIDVIPTTSLYDESDASRSLSNKIITSVSVGCEENCLHCDLNNSIYSICLECQPEYVSDSNGQCVLA